MDRGDNAYKTPQPSLKYQWRHWPQWSLFDHRQHRVRFRQKEASFVTILRGGMKLIDVRDILLRSE